MAQYLPLLLMLILAALFAGLSFFASRVLAPQQSTAAKVAPYTEFKPTAIASWHPERRELIVARRAGNVTQLHRVAAPGSEPQQLTAFSEPVRFGAYLAKKPGAKVIVTYVDRSGTSHTATVTLGSGPAQ